MLDEQPVAPWTDLYLRFSSEQAAYEQLLAAGLLQEGYAPVDASVDYIGVIYKPTGKMIDDEQPEMAPLPGWHVNVRLSADKTCPESLQSAIVSPVTPVRVWA
tara:strand:- start:112 stop:420 length:309 start_codon:yes stop_codon:yes gene_type:complete